MRMGALFVVLIAAVVGLAAQAPPAREAACAVGEGGTIVLGHNFWVASTAKEKSVKAVQSAAALWLGCADHDLATGHDESAGLRLNEILEVLRARKADELLIASTQFRRAHLDLARGHFAPALQSAREAVGIFDRRLGQAGAGKTSPIWLNWGGYDESVMEPIMALHVLARAQRMSGDKQWQATMDRSIAMAEKSAGRNSALYRASVQLKQDLGK
jgi:hypothetical protein